MFSLLTWTVTDTGVTGCVSLTGDKPTLGTFTRAVEAQSVTCAAVGDAINTVDTYRYTKSTSEVLIYVCQSYN